MPTWSRPRRPGGGADPRSPDPWVFASSPLQSAFAKRLCKAPSQSAFAKFKGKIRSKIQKRRHRHPVGCSQTVGAHAMLLALAEFLWVNKTCVQAMLSVWLSLDPVSMVCVVAIAMSICTQGVSATQSAVSMSAANPGASGGSKLYGIVSQQEARNPKSAFSRGIPRPRLIWWPPRHCPGAHPPGSRFERDPESAAAKEY